MAVFFRMVVISSTKICVELNFIVFKIRLNLILNKNKIKIVTKNKIYYLNKKLKRSGSSSLSFLTTLPKPAQALFTLKRKYLSFKFHSDARFSINHGAKNLFIIFLTLFHNSKVVNSQENSKNLTNINFYLDLQFLVVLHLKCIISYLFKILKSTNIKEKQNGSNV